MITQYLSQRSRHGLSPKHSRAECHHARTQTRLPPSAQDEASQQADPDRLKRMAPNQPLEIEAAGLMHSGLHTASAAQDVAFRSIRAVR
jgi:hypothetical protein